MFEGRYDSKKNDHWIAGCTGDRRRDGAVVDGSVTGIRRFDRYSDRSQRCSRFRSNGSAEERCHRRVPYRDDRFERNLSFSLLPPGSYTVTVTASGFSKTSSTANVAIGQASIADVKMAVGASSTTVEVTTAAPLVQADNADLSTNFNQNLISNSPNGGNDLSYIAQTSPGAVMNTASGYGNFSVYGSPPPPIFSRSMARTIWIRTST